MTFLEQILASLERSGDAVVLQEMHDGQAVRLTARQLLAQVLVARAYLRRLRLKKGDRCALLAHNSMQWVAMDLAIMAEGLTVVPLYARQAPAELVAMMKDCWPAVIACGEKSLADAIAEAWPEAPPSFCFENVFTAGREPAEDPALEVAEEDVVTIIYTSGTSGEAKGVMLNAGNVGHMLGCTSGRLDHLMKGRPILGDTGKTRPGQDAVFHYLPLCFAGSWIMMLTCLLRGSKLTLNTDLGKIATEMRLAAPDYFLNVPALLERMRKAVDEQLWKYGRISVEGAHQGKGRVGAAAGGTIACRGRVLARAGESAGVSYHPQKDDRRQTARADLWLGAAECGDATIFYDAGHSRFASVRPDRDDGDLHHG